MKDVDEFKRLRLRNERGRSSRGDGQTCTIADLELIGALIERRINKILSIVCYVMRGTTIRIPCGMIGGEVYWLEIGNIRLWKDGSV